MKKILLGLSIVLCLFLVGCGSKTYTEISFSEHEKMIREKKSFILFVGADTCSACTTYKETLNKVIKDYGIDVYYIDINKMDTDDKAKFSTYYYIESTPTTVFITEGEETTTYNRIESAVSYDKVVAAFKERGYIKGDS